MFSRPNVKDNNNPGEKALTIEISKLWSTQRLNQKTVYQIYGMRKRNSNLQGRKKICEVLLSS